MDKIVEGMIEYEEAQQEIKPEKCSICGEDGVYRYAPYDFSHNWSEESRWRCWEHGKCRENDAEWDYFGDI